MRLGSSFLKQSKFTRQFINRRKALPTFNYLSVAAFCSKAKPPPEEFYDEEVEKDKELFDIYEVRQKGRSFETLTTNKVLSLYLQLINKILHTYFYSFSLSIQKNNRR